MRGRLKGQKVKAYILLLVIACYLIFVPMALAVEGGEHHTTTWKDWFWPVVNFLVLVAVLVYFGRRPIREYFKKRTELIEKSLREAEEARRFARKALEEVQERLRNTDQEVKEIIEGARKAGEREKEALIAEGERLRKKILEQARTNIEFELEKAKKEIKSEAALIAIELAEKQIKEKLGREEQEALIDEYIQRLSATADSKDRKG
jgi:F-type H+-transporting ATPase subunit b